MWALVIIKKRGTLYLGDFAQFQSTAYIVMINRENPFGKQNNNTRNISHK